MTCKFFKLSLIFQTHIFRKEIYLELNKNIFDNLRSTLIFIVSDHYASNDSITNKRNVTMK